MNPSLMPRTDRRQSRPANRQGFAWQGWRLELPGRWNPVKLEGDWDSGKGAFADLHRERLGVVWQRPTRRKFDAGRWADAAMADEVGKLAGAEAVAFAPGGDADNWPGGLLYLDPDPPGRDVFVGYSRASGRAIKVIYHARRRERVLPEAILPHLSDSPAGEPTVWSVFELSCVVPAGLTLSSQRLNAGDLSLTFTGTPANPATDRPTRWRRSIDLTVRQVALASLALQRQPLERWLRIQQGLRGRHYRALKQAEELTLVADDGRALKGLAGTSVRRRRFAWALWLPPSLRTVALHDASRDRLVIAQGTEPGLVDGVAKTVGCSPSE